MESPTGSVEVALRIDASSSCGTVDWSMTFRDGSVAKAYSRIVESGAESCIYSFVLMAPPVPLEQIEGALEQQSGVLAEELARLRKILEQSPSGAE